MPAERTGPRPRKDIRSRVLSALSTEPATATQIAERAGIPGREAALVLARLEVTGPAISEACWRQVPRWRAPPAALASPRSDTDPGA